MNTNEEQLDYTQPPKNVFNIPNLCPKCGGTGIVRPSGKFYDTQSCPTCNGSGKIKKTTNES